MTPEGLEKAFIAKLKASGLSKADAKKLGLKPFLECAAKQRFPELASFYVRDGIYVPYYDLHGNKIKNYFRYCNLDRQPRGFEGLTAKGKKGPPKYVAPGGSCPEIYVPQLLTMDWLKIAQDTNKPVISTEGEFKACCGVKFGLPTIALSGVDSFSSKRNKLLLLKSFDWFDLKGRELYHIVDSDAADNPFVRDAVRRYCARLTGRGARVFPITLPALPGLEKTGLDDYLLHEDGGKERLVELMEESTEFEASAELHEMNEIAIYVRDVSRVCIPDEGLLLEERAFINNYKPRTFVVTYESGGKSRTEEKSVPMEWMKWPYRRECKATVCDPMQPPLQVGPNDKFNMFRGLAVCAEKGDIAPWTELMDWMFPPAQTIERRWFLDWVAHPLQCIEAMVGPKMHSCAVLISTQQGTGKGLVGETIGALYKPAFASITTGELKRDFNGWAKDILFVLGNEITGRDAAAVADGIKALITEPQFWLNRKNVKEVSQPNHMNFLFTSNHEDAFFVSFSDRRFFAHFAPAQSLLEVWGKEKVDKYVAWYNSHDGQAALLYHLLHHKITPDWDHRSPPDTPAKLALQKNSANQAVSWLRDVAGNPELLQGRLKERWFWTAKELLAIFQATTGRAGGYSPDGMGRALSDAKWYRFRCSNPTGQVRYLKLKDCPKAALWTPPLHAQEVKQHITTERAAAEQFNRERELLPQKEKY